MISTIFKNLFGLGFDPSSYRAPEGIPDPDSERELVLYQFGSCPWCLRVMRVVDDTGIEVSVQDTRGSKEASDYLWDKTQRTQVPCLFIDDVPLFESADINKWLYAYAARGWPGKAA